MDYQDDSIAARIADREKDWLDMYLPAHVRQVMELTQADRDKFMKDWFDIAEVQMPDTNTTH